jgi:hypothetical protein
MKLQRFSKEGKANTQNSIVTNSNVFTQESVQVMIPKIAKITDVLLVLGEAESDSIL